MTKLPGSQVWQENLRSRAEFILSPWPVHIGDKVSWTRRRVARRCSCPSRNEHDGPMLVFTNDSRPLKANLLVSQRGGWGVRTFATITVACNVSHHVSSYSCYCWRTSLIHSHPSVLAWQPGLRYAMSTKKRRERASSRACPFSSCYACLLVPQNICTTQTINCAWYGVPAIPQSGRPCYADTSTCSTPKPACVSLG